MIEFKMFVAEEDNVESSLSTINYGAPLKLPDFHYVNNEVEEPAKAVNQAIA